MEGRYFEQKRMVELLRGALAEMDVLRAEQSPSRESVEHVDRWTLRWTELVEAMIWHTPAGPDADELREALARLRAMAPTIRRRPAAPFSGLSTPERVSSTAEF